MELITIVGSVASLREFFLADFVTLFEFELFGTLEIDRV